MYLCIIENEILPYLFLCLTQTRNNQLVTYLPGRVIFPTSGNGPVHHHPMTIRSVVHAQVGRALYSRSVDLRFDSQCWPCVEVSGKLQIPHCLCPPSSNDYLVYRIQGWINSCRLHWHSPCQGKGKVRKVIYCFQYMISQVGR